MKRFLLLLLLSAGAFLLAFGAPGDIFLDFGPNDRRYVSGFREDPRHALGRLGAGDAVEEIPTDVGGYQRFYEGVVAALRTGGPPPVDPADAVAGLEIIEAARRSASEGRVIEL